MMMQYKIFTKYLSPHSKRTLFYWINLQFNALDHERKKILGPDRTCAEWILRNGGSVKVVNSEDIISNYNKLPPEDKALKLQEVDATNTNIMHKGFEHFSGCKHITKLIIHRCNYLEDSALEELRYLKNSLSYLQVSSCHNITDKGLLQLEILSNLNDLILNNLPSVKDLPKTVQALKSSLPRCNIQV